MTISFSLKHYSSQSCMMHNQPRFLLTAEFGIFVQWNDSQILERRGHMDQEPNVNQEDFTRNK